MTSVPRPPSPVVRRLSSAVRSLLCVDLTVLSHAIDQGVQCDTELALKIVEPGFSLTQAPDIAFRERLGDPPGIEWFRNGEVAKDRGGRLNLAAKPPHLSSLSSARIITHKEPYCVDCARGAQANDPSTKDPSGQSARPATGRNVLPAGPARLSPLVSAPFHPSGDSSSKEEGADSASGKGRLAPHRGSYSSNCKCRLTAVMVVNKAQVLIWIGWGRQESPLAKILPGSIRAGRVARAHSPGLAGLPQAGSRWILTR